MSPNLTPLLVSNKIPDVNRWSHLILCCYNLENSSEKINKKIVQHDQLRFQVSTTGVVVLEFYNLTGHQQNVYFDSKSS